VAELHVVRLYNDGPEEVTQLADLITLAGIDQSTYVLPQGSPLILLVPDIWPLEQRYHQLLRKIEDLHGRANSGFHRDILPRHFPQ
jgi:hypothetical protein